MVRLFNAGDLRIEWLNIHSDICFQTCKPWQIKHCYSVQMPSIRKTISEHQWTRCHRLYMAPIHMYYIFYFMGPISNIILRYWEQIYQYSLLRPTFASVVDYIAVNVRTILTTDLMKLSTYLALLHWWCGNCCKCKIIMDKRVLIASTYIVRNWAVFYSYHCTKIFYFRPMTICQ